MPDRTVPDVPTVSSTTPQISAGEPAKPPASAWEYLRVHPPRPKDVPVTGGILEGGKIEPTLGRVSRRASLGSSPQEMRQLLRDLPQFHDPTAE